MNAVLIINFLQLFIGGLVTILLHLSQNQSLMIWEIHLFSPFGRCGKRGKRFLHGETTG